MEFAHYKCYYYYYYYYYYYIYVLVCYHILLLLWLNLYTKEVENLKSVREQHRFFHQGGGFTSQYAPVGWGLVKICNDVKSNPHLGPVWGEGGRDFN